MTHPAARTSRALRASLSAAALLALAAPPARAVAPARATAPEPAPTSAPDTPPPAADYSSVISAAWAALQAQDFPRAEALYLEATQLQPASEDAWLGLQRARLGREDWRGALDAGQRALALDPESRWAHLRLGLALYMLGDYEAARPHYEAALAAAPDDATARLGLGFTLVQLGHLEAGRRACDQARAARVDAPRVAECLALADAKAEAGRAHTRLGLVGGGFGYAGAGALDSYTVFTATAGGRWPSGFDLWGGLTVLQAQGADGGATYAQTIPGLGLGWRGTRGWFGVSGAVLTGNSAAPKGAVATASGGYLNGWGASLSGSGLFMTGGLTGQGDAKLLWAPSESLTVALGGRVIASPGPRAVELALGGPGGAGGAMSSSSSGGSSSTQLDLSASLGLTWRPSRLVELSASGWYGGRRFAVEDQGLSVWSSDEHYVGGYSVGLTLHVHRLLTLSAAFRHDVGDAVAGAPDDFAVVGGTLGLSTVF